MFSKLLIIVDACTKFEVSSFSLSEDIRNTNIKNLGAVRHLVFHSKYVVTILQLRRGHKVGYSEILGQ